jgi:hypothetical protein
VDAPSLEIDVRPSEREHLSRAQARQRADQVGGAERLGERGGDALDVLSPSKPPMRERMPGSP